MSCSDPAIIHCVDHRVPHNSTVPAIMGETIEIFLREKCRSWPSAFSPVLLVHGAFSPCTVAFDLPFGTYSWMDNLARAGFDAFALDLTGYGQSPHPMMDIPANIAPAMRLAMGVGDVGADAAPTYPFELVTSQSEWDEIDRVVDFIRAQRGADKVSMIGWSSGGKRAGGYASLHPEKIDKLVLVACANYEPEGPSRALRPVPYPGYPMMIQNRDVGERQRWTAFVQSEKQVDPKVRDFVWQKLMESDPLGASWGPGVVRAPTRSYWGWNRQAATLVKAPTLMIVGEADKLMSSNETLFEHLGTSAKAFVTVTDASHFMVWESKHTVLHSVALEWLSAGTYQARECGRFHASSDKSTGAIC